MEATTSGTKSLVIDKNPPIVPTESQQQQDRMKSKFEKYWGNFENMNMLLLVAVVLDPRYKMKYVNFTLSKAYGPLLGRLKSEDVASVLTRLYDSYSNSVVDASSNDNIGGDTSMSETDDLLESEWEKHLADMGNISKKSDLEIYLMDDVVKNKDFDILSWWKVSSSKYPVVSKIARDVLSIPFLRCIRVGI
ncbi:zinc finger BED domain-containing protein RICESLEEPER 1-like [Lycium ferocissimum]|uniref:zinc finger BED domain-containing protein RICESLEEPER 1-like n=1 Tax=Lycium ferocissimum TaxID=112874 RepID=UPI00281696CE|nr:zinc finger BED domain-containing protein RICESLEEPER 1-like [Lycium ferocissimum]